MHSHIKIEIEMNIYGFILFLFSSLSQLFRVFSFFSEYPSKAVDPAKLIQSYSKKAPFIIENNSFEFSGFTEIIEARGYSYLATVSSQYENGDFMPDIFSSSSCARQWSSKGKLNLRIIILA